MDRPTVKITRKVGLHVMAFSLGALAPLPLLRAIDRTAGPTDQATQAFECHGRTGSATAIYLYPLHSPALPFIRQDVGEHFIHNVPERYMLVDSTVLEEGASFADPGS